MCRGSGAGLGNTATTLLVLVVLSTGTASARPNSFLAFTPRPFTVYRFALLNGSVCTIWHNLREAFDPSYNTNVDHTHHAIRFSGHRRGKVRFHFYNTILYYSSTLLANKSTNILLPEQPRHDSLPATGYSTALL